MTPPSACVTWTNIHERTWNTLKCKPNSTCKSDGLLSVWRLASSVCFESCRGNHYRETWPRSSPSWHVPARNRTQASRVGSEHSRNPESMLLAIRNIYIWARKQWRMLSTVFIVEAEQRRPVSILALYSSLYLPSCTIHECVISCCKYTVTVRTTRALLLFGGRYMHPLKYYV